MIKAAEGAIIQTLFCLAVKYFTEIMSEVSRPEGDGARKAKKSREPVKLESNSLASSAYALVLKQLLSPKYSKPTTIKVGKAHPEQTEALLASLCPTLQPETIKQILSTLNRLTSLDCTKIRIEQSDGPISTITESKQFLVGERNFKYCEGKIKLLINDRGSILLEVATTGESVPINPSGREPYFYTIEASFLSAQAKPHWKQLRSFIQKLCLHDLETVVADSDLETFRNKRIISAHFNRSLTIDFYVEGSLRDRAAACFRVKDESPGPARPDHPLDGHWLPNSIQLQGPTRLERIQIERLLKSREINEIEASGLMEEAYSLVANKSGLEFDTIWKFHDMLPDTIALKFAQTSALDEDPYGDSYEIDDEDDLDDEDYDDEDEDDDDIDEISDQEEDYLDEGRITFDGLPTALGTVSVELLPYLEISTGTTIDTVSHEYDADKYDCLPVIRIDLSQLQKDPSKTRLIKAWTLIGKIGQIINQPSLLKDLREAIEQKSEKNDEINYRDDRVLVHCGKYGPES